MKKPPLGLNELIIDRYRKRDTTGAVVPDPVLDALAGALKSARGTAEQISVASAAILSDATSTPAANALRAKNTALNLAERATRALDEARGRAASEITKLQNSMKVESPKDAAELRAALARMTPADRNKALADELLIQAALSGAHPILAGIPAPDFEMLKSRYQRDRFPNEVDRLSRLEGASASLDRAGRALIEYVKGIDSPEVSAAEANARQAQQAIAAATTAAE